jgi:DNA-binding beta-propeller fold protein YncE
MMPENVMNTTVQPVEAFTWNQSCAIPFSADLDAQRAIDGIGRTEDVHFSPDNQRLALVGHLDNRLLVLGVRLAGDGATPRIHLHSPQEILSDAFAYPHGVFWINDETLIVANRQGDAPILRVPPASPVTDALSLEPLVRLCTDGPDGMVHTPGSVSVAVLDGGWLEVLLCNNYAHHVSQHLLDARNGYEALAGSRLLADGLDIPDGVAQSRDQRWIAVSNHNEHCVLVYENTATLGPSCPPAAVLRGMNYPHGLRWTRDGQFLLVADAGLPFVHVFQCGGGGWQGECHPIQTLRVLDEQRFRRGQYNPQEGGPKGIDLSADDRVLVTTTQEQALAFFDLEPVLGPARRAGADADRPATTAPTLARHVQGQARTLNILAECRQQERTRHEQERARYEQECARHEAALVATSLALEQAQRLVAERLSEIETLRSVVDQQQRHIQQVANSHSWRLTAPYRLLRQRLRDLFPGMAG